MTYYSFVFYNQNFKKSVSKPKLSPPSIPPKNYLNFFYFGQNRFFYK